MSAPWTPYTLAQMSRPFGQLLDIALTGEKEGEVSLQWLNVDLVGDSTPQKGERITFHLSEVRSLVDALEVAMETATEVGLSLDPPPPPKLPLFGGSNE